MRASQLAARMPYHRSAAGDPFYNSVVLGIDYDGVNGQTTFTDWSLYNHPLFSHNTTVDTANALFGTGGGIMAGNHNVEANDAPELRLTTGDLTIETAVKMKSFASNGVVFIKCVSTGFFPFLVYVSTSGQVVFQMYDQFSNLVVNVFSPAALTIGLYQRIAITRNTALNLAVLWIDGIAVASAALPGTTVLWSDTGPFLFGQFATFVASIDAYQDESRATAVCRYGGVTGLLPYTPAIAAFPHHL